MPFHGRFLELVEKIEGNFAVARWKCADVEVWPLARMDLYLDMHWANADSLPPVSQPLPLRAIGRLATPLSNVWKSRRDLSRWMVRPKPAHAILLGDGVSLDKVGGEWQDRFGEPIIADLERRGLTTFLMQAGELTRLPWHRPTFSANIVAAWGALTASAWHAPTDLPEHAQVREFLCRHGVRAASLSRARLERRAKVVLATACAFERILRIVKPTLAFVVSYYAGLGPAFLVACRRQHLLSIDLQHCPQEGAHKAYGWWAVPNSGYAALPSVFWNWTARDAAYIRGWAEKSIVPWHTSMQGGHTQLAPFLDNNDERTQACDARFRSVGEGRHFEREILVALQSSSGHEAQWEALAQQIEAAPSRWRWWIRRHPAAAPHQDEEHRRLLALRLPNVLVDEASSLPLPALLRHMSVMLSLASGASAEAAMFGVPALFLSEAARVPFAGLIERGQARVIDLQHLAAEIARLTFPSVRVAPIDAPKLSDSLSALEGRAGNYAQQCEQAAAAHAD